jgi:hypothetical protein
MPQGFQFSLRVLAQVLLYAIAWMCLSAMGRHAGPLGSACLFELAFTVLGVAAALQIERPRMVLPLFVILPLPFAYWVFVLTDRVGR